MADVRIYTTRICPYCSAAKELFDRKGVAYEEIDVSRDPETRAWLRRATGQHTVPQIFVGERSCGGYTDVRALEHRGELDRMLTQGARRLSARSTRRCAESK